MAAGKPPAKKAPAKKVAAKKAAPRKRAPRKAGVTEQDRAEAREQIATVTPIKGAGAPSRRGRGEGRKREQGKNNPTSPESLRLFERREKSLNLRRLGLQWEQVAHRIREEYTEVPAYTAADAYKDAKTLIDSVTVEAVQQVREDDLAMLLALQRRVFPAALDGDLKAVDRMLRILERRARYLGLDAPTRHELTGAGGGAVAITQMDPRELHDAVLDKLDELLPHIEQPQLPAGS